LVGKDNMSEKVLSYHMIVVTEHEPGRFVVRLEAAARRDDKLHIDVQKRLHQKDRLTLDEVGQVLVESVRYLSEAFAAAKKAGKE
jgi:hypothetical protein